MTQLNLFPEIFIRDRHAFCTSLDVATHFGKNHWDVLKATATGWKTIPQSSTKAILLWLNTGTPRANSAPCTCSPATPS